MNDVVELLRQTAGAVAMTAGAVLMLGNCIALLRFPDFYARAHAASACIGWGGASILAGLALSAPDLALAARLFLLALLVAAFGPVTISLLANAAHAGGLAPITGKYAAPRPGASRARTSGP
ncbi:MAG: monovalent cation/H(+) antiporter subunit G [Hyphomonadaceae bacterium]